MNSFETLFSSTTLFNKIVDDLATQGYSLNPGALPPSLCLELADYLSLMSQNKFSEAGVGRGQDFIHEDAIRTDKTCWITGESKAGKAWLNWTSEFQACVNRSLFMGLFSFESHFAHYQAGDFYVRHYDAFRGQQNRVLTVVTYLNDDWKADDGGELILYRSDNDTEGLTVLPQMGTVVIFLSEEFPHEVKPAVRDRYSIAGWFRVNNPHSLPV